MSAPTQWTGCGLFTCRAPAVIKWCAHHWAMIPKEFQILLLAKYRSGEITKAYAEQAQTVRRLLAMVESMKALELPKEAPAT